LKFDDNTCILESKCYADGYYTNHDLNTCLTAVQCKDLTTRKGTYFSGWFTLNYYFNDKPTSKTCVTEAQCSASNVKVDGESTVCVNPTKCTDNKYTNFVLQECQFYGQC